MKNLDSYFKNVKKNNYAAKENIKENLEFSDTSYEKISENDFKDSRFINDNKTAKDIITTSQFKNIDYSNFSNHVFFDSAVHKVSYSFDDIIKFPYDKKEKDVYEYFNSLDGYTEYVLSNIYPKYIGGINFTGNEKILIKDKKGHLLRDFNDSKISEGLLSPQRENYSFRFWLNISEINTQIDNQVLFKKVNLNAVNELEGFLCFLTKNNQGWNINYLVSHNNRYIVETHNILPELLLENFHVTINYSVNEAKNIRLTFLINGNPVESITTNTLMHQDYSFEFKKRDVEFIIGNSENLNFNGIQYNNFYGKIDEFIYLSKNSTSKSIKLEKDDNIFTNDTVNLYLKFNEPGGEYVNSNLIIDSSGNKYHGLLLNNNNEKIVDTSINKAVTSMLNKEDINYSPVIIGSYQSIVEERTKLLTLAKNYDINNANIIFKLIPKHYFITSGNFENKPDYISTELSTPNVVEFNTENNNLGFESNNKNNHLSNICLIWARFFDQLKLHVDAISNLQKCDYDDINNEKYINAHIELLCKKYGFDFAPIFENITKENIKGKNLENEDVISEHDFIKVQNLVWKKILINSQDIIRSKGTHHSLNSLLNSLGANIKNFLNINEKSYDNYIDLTRQNFNVEDFYIYNINFGQKNNFTDQTNYNAAGFPTNKCHLNIENIKYLDDHQIEQSGLPKNWSIEYIFNFNDLIKKDYDLKQIVKNKKDFIKYDLKQSLFRLDVDNDCYLNLYLHFKNKDALLCDIVLDIDPFIHNPSYRSAIRINDINIFEISNYICINFDYDITSDNAHDILNISIDYNKYNVSDTSDFKKHNNKTFKIRKNSYNNNLLSFYNKNVSLRVGEYQYDIDELKPNKINNIFENLTPTNFQGEISSITVWKDTLSKKEIYDHSNDMISISAETNGDDFVNKNKCIFKLLNRKSLDSTDGIFDLMPTNFLKKYTNYDLNTVKFINQNNDNFENNFIKRKYQRRFNDIVLNNNTSKNLVFINSLNKEENKVLYNNFKENPTDDYNELIDKTEINVFTLEFSNSLFYNKNINKLLLNIDNFNKTFLSTKNRIDYNYYNLSKLRNEYFKDFSENDLFDFNELYNIFKYFDNILNEIITEMIPSKMSFKGFNFVYESHALERFNYDYRNKKRFIENTDINYVYKPYSNRNRNKF